MSQEERLKRLKLEHLAHDPVALAKASQARRNQLLQKADLPPEPMDEEPETEDSDPNLGAKRLAKFKAQNAAILGRRGSPPSPAAPASQTGLASTLDSLEVDVVRLPNEFVASETLFQAGTGRPRSDGDDESEETEEQAVLAEAKRRESVRRLALGSSTWLGSEGKGPQQSESPLPIDSSEFHEQFVGKLEEGQEGDVK